MLGRTTGTARSTRVTRPSLAVPISSQSLIWTRHPSPRTLETEALAEPVRWMANVPLPTDSDKYFASDPGKQSACADKANMGGYRQQQQPGTHIQWPECRTTSKLAHSGLPVMTNVFALATGDRLGVPLPCAGHVLSAPIGLMPFQVASALHRTAHHSRGACSCC